MSIRATSNSALRHITINAADIGLSIRRLSSGQRITRAADDPAGSAISSGMQAQIRGMDRAMRNVQDATSLLRVADAAMGEIESMVQRIRELTVYAANDTQTINSRQMIQLEINQLITEIDSVAHRTQFNERTLLTGRYAPPLAHGVGASQMGFSSPLAQAGFVPSQGAASIAPISGSHSQTRVLPTASAGRTININDLHNAAATNTDYLATYGWWFDWNASLGRGTLRITASTDDGLGAFHVTGDFDPSDPTPNASAVNTAIVLTENAELNVDLILENVNIRSNFNSALRSVGSDLNLHLVGDNRLLSNRPSYSAAGIFVESGPLGQGGNLRIYGTDNDTLYARGGANSAGIGSFRLNTGSVTILGGNITAHGSGQAAGIGGERGGLGIINIEGGIVRAFTTGSGAAIGGGYRTHGGEITISGGYVYARVGGHSAAIGGGMDAGSGVIRIEGGIVRAYGGRTGAVIGGGAHNVVNAPHLANITITGGTVYATAVATGHGAAIGVGASGTNNHNSIITIGGDARVTAIAGIYGAGIGGARGRGAGTIIIEGEAIVNATGGRDGAGIGAGAVGTGGSITIRGDATVRAEGVLQGAGIGGGSRGNWSAGVINIYGNANVRAYASTLGSAIGGGMGGVGGTINIGCDDDIWGPRVTAIGRGSQGAAVGGGGDTNNAGANLTIRGGLLEVLSGRIGGGWATSPTGTINFIDGNLSVRNPNTNVHGNTNFHAGESTHIAGTARRTEVYLFDIETNERINFGAHEHLYFYINVNGERIRINSIADSEGRFFIYTPADLDIDGDTMHSGGLFTGELTTLPNHDGMLRLSGQPEPPPQPPPIYEMLPPPVVGRPISGRPLHMQVGPNSFHSMFVTIGAVTATRLGLRNENGFAINVVHPGGIDVTGHLNYFDQALGIIGRERAHVGAQESRLHHIMNSLEVQHSNVSDAHSRIADADMFREHMRHAWATMRQQAGIMVMAQSQRMQVTQSHVLINNLSQASYTVGSRLS